MKTDFSLVGSPELGADEHHQFNKILKFLKSSAIIQADKQGFYFEIPNPHNSGEIFIMRAKKDMLRFVLACSPAKLRPIVQVKIIEWTNQLGNSIVKFDDFFKLMIEDAPDMFSISDNDERWLTAYLENQLDFWTDVKDIPWSYHYNSYYRTTAFCNNKNWEVWDTVKQTVSFLKFVDETINGKDSCSVWGWPIHCEFPPFPKMPLRISTCEVPNFIQHSIGHLYYWAGALQGIFTGIFKILTGVEAHPQRIRALSKRFDVIDSRLNRIENHVETYGLD